MALSEIVWAVYSDCVLVFMDFFQWAIIQLKKIQQNSHHSFESLIKMKKDSISKNPYLTG